MIHPGMQVETLALARPTQTMILLCTTMAIATQRMMTTKFLLVKMIFCGGQEGKKTRWKNR